jgi:CRISPR-associated protein Cas1
MSGHLALVVDQAGASLEAGSHGTVVLLHADGRRERVGVRALASVILHGDVKLSAGLLRMLSEHQVSLAALSGRGRSGVCGFTRLPHTHAQLRHRQHLAYADPPQRLELARAVVAAKLDAMAEFALRHAPDAASAVDASRAAVAQANELPAIMGIEGAASARHFSLLEQLYARGGQFRFEGRSRRPPEDPPNALMSLAYGLAQAQAAQLVLRAGLDVQLGFLHSLHRDRQSLALDLLEPARAAIDNWVHEILVQRAAIVPAMFTATARGPTWLTKEGRAAFYPLWFREGYRIVMPPMRSLLAGALVQLRRAPRGAAASDS